MHAKCMHAKCLHVGTSFCLASRKGRLIQKGDGEWVFNAKLNFKISVTLNLFLNFQEILLVILPKKCNGQKI